MNRAGDDAERGAAAAASINPVNAGLQLHAAVADRGLDVQFSVAPGEVLAILGPNGAGKSTVLHIIAGLLRPDEGSVRLGQRLLTDIGSGVDVPTHDRRVGLLLQNPLLFPHLNAVRNVAFGLHNRHHRAHRPPGGRIAGRGAARRWLREVDAEQLAHRKPRQLSGGQAQRVAIARALAAEPDVLLLDEPLSGLDVAAAASVRAVLRQVVAGNDRAVVLVTHDLVDVFTLADRVLVLESGKVAEIGDTADVLAAPRSRFGARIAGVNLVAGVIGTDGALRTPWGDRWHGTADDGLAAGRHAFAVFTPAAVSVHRELPCGGPHNAVAVTVAELGVRGAAIWVRAADQADGGPGLVADIAADVAAGLGLAAGEAVWFCVKAPEVTLRAADSPP